MLRSATSVARPVTIGPSIVNTTSTANKRRSESDKEPITSPSSNISYEVKDVEQAGRTTDTKPEPNPDNALGVVTQPSSGPPERTDVLFCLGIREANGASRTYYKDTPWQGINSHLNRSEPVVEKDDLESCAVLAFCLGGVVTKLTEHASNTPMTWKARPVDFEIGQQANLQMPYMASIRFYSKRVIKVIDAILDYYPRRVITSASFATVGGTFIDIMHCYGELKEYFKTYQQSPSIIDQANSKLDIGDCGDEKFSEAMQPHLDYGKLDISANPCDEPTACDLAVLLRFLAEMYRTKVVPTFTSIYLDPKPVVAYDSLWLLFRPGTIVYIRSGMRRALIPKSNEGKDQCLVCIVASSTYSNGEASKDPSGRPKAAKMPPHLQLEMWYVQHDGIAFRRVEQHENIIRYDGFISLKELFVIPSHLHDMFDGGALRQQLEERGSKYLSIFKEPTAHRKYRYADGLESQIIVDPSAYRQFESDEEPFGTRRKGMVPPLTPAKNLTHASIRDSDTGDGDRFSLSIFNDSNSEQGGDRTQLNRMRLLLPGEVEGFDLRTKKWVVFSVEKISDRAPTRSLNQLDTELVLMSDVSKESLRTVLPKGEHPFCITPDFVEGKGEGQIFLLYGGPGTGKTLTVECVANDTNRPLLHLTVQDVGYVHNAESLLRKWFTLAAKWDAILLIDEADLFLEQRRQGDIQRNSLSTIFLRTMEYYQGVLFLTTNRPGHIDDSFISRITCPIFYPQLSLETKGKIVEKFVTKFEDTGTVSIEHAAKRYLMTNCNELNGRQIRNVMQNAVASAEVKLRADRRLTTSRNLDQSPHLGIVTVKLNHVKAAIERQTAFRDYLKDLRGKDETARAKTKQDYLGDHPGIAGL